MCWAGGISIDDLYRVMYGLEWGHELHWCSHRRVVLVCIPQTMEIISKITCDKTSVCTSISILRLGCCQCPIWRATLNNNPPSISVLWVNARQATFSDIIPHTFQPHLSRLSLSSSLAQYLQHIYASFLYILMISTDSLVDLMTTLKMSNYNCEILFAHEGL